MDSLLKNTSTSFQGSYSAFSALISVSDKRNLASLGHQIEKLNGSILASSGTAYALQNEGIQATPISEYTQSPECLGGRVKTLHPALFALAL